MEARNRERMEREGVDGSGQMAMGRLTGDRRSNRVPPLKRAAADYEESPAKRRGELVPA